MTDGYTGWKLLDKVTIVAKRMLAYDYKTGSTTDTGNVQGYSVDPSNKKQLENARQWGTVTTWEYFTDEEGRNSVRDESQVDYWHRAGKLIGFKRLEKPREFIFYPSYSKGKDKLSDYSAWTWQCRDSVPARRDSGKTIEMDISMDKVVKMFEENNIHSHHRDWSTGKGYVMNIATDCVGLSASDDPSYTLPEEVRKVLKDYGLVVYEG